MNVAIVGARPPPPESAEDSARIYSAILMDVVLFVRGLAPGTSVVSGGAAGVDRTAAMEAERCGLHTIVHLPNYERFGPLAAPRERNYQIVRDPSMRGGKLHAWPAPWSKGTWHALRIARSDGVLYEVHRPWLVG